MEIKKIRIGNDIRLAVDLRQYINLGGDVERQVVIQPVNTEASSTGDTITSVSNPVSIRSIKAVLVNQSRKEEADERLRKTSRFVSRFPIEPAHPCYVATAYDVCNSGCPTWRAYPHQCVAPYHGFGAVPKWDGIYNKWGKPEDIDYVANVFATKDQNIVEVDFPAHALLHTGVYKLVVVAQVYAPGYSANNLKTVTVDIPEVFELVDSSANAYDSDVFVNVSHVVDVLPNNKYELMKQDIYAYSGSLDENNINIQRNDGSSFDVDVSTITDWYNAED